MPPQQPANITTFDQKGQIRIYVALLGLQLTHSEEIHVQVKGKKGGLKGCWRCCSIPLLMRVVVAFQLLYSHLYTGPARQQAH